MILPKISVVIPLYNKRSHILDSLNSVLKQSYLAHEVIIMTTVPAMVVPS